MIFRQKNAQDVAQFAGYIQIHLLFDLTILLSFPVRVISLIRWCCTLKFFSVTYAYIQDNIKLFDRFQKCIKLYSQTYAASK